MALMKCVECGKEISDRADNCPYCGCPVGAESIWGSIDFVWVKGVTQNFNVATIYVDGVECGKIMNRKTVNIRVSLGLHSVKLLRNGKCMLEESIPISKDSPNVSFYIKETISGKLEKTTMPIENVPKCPTCGSTKVKKLSLGRKVFSVEMIGFASSSAGKTFVCKNCGYKW